MERRCEPRISADEPVVLTILAELPESCSGQAIELSGSGMRLRLARAVTLGTPVKIEFQDTLLLAEVCHARREGEAWIVGVKIEQILTRLADLQRLNQRLLDGSEELRPFLARS